MLAYCLCWRNMIIWAPHHGMLHFYNSNSASMKVNLSYIIWSYFNVIYLFDCRYSALIRCILPDIYMFFSTLLNSHPASSWLEETCILTRTGGKLKMYRAVVLVRYISKYISNRTAVHSLLVSDWGIFILFLSRYQKILV